MISITSTVFRRSSLLLPAALLAAGIALGGSAVVDPATACAEPKKPFNKDGYYACVDQAIKDNKENKITDAQMKDIVNGCCYLAGGKVDDKGRCDMGQAAQAPGRLPPGVDIQTLTPVPPADPAAPPPMVITPAP